MAYNGWTNWETWLTYLHVFDGAADLYGDKATPEACRDYVEEWLQEGNLNLFVQDIVGGFIGEVNWQEIADHVNED